LEVNRLQFEVERLVRKVAATGDDATVERTTALEKLFESQNAAKAQVASLLKESFWPFDRH